MAASDIDEQTPMTIETPLEDVEFILVGFSGSEAVSELFKFDLDLLVDTDTDVPFDKLLGQSVTVTVPLRDGSTRYFNGVVSKFTQGGLIGAGQGKDVYIRYHAEVVPEFWLLTHLVHSRTFQQITVSDILDKVLTGLDTDNQLQATYYERDYCVQYRESDFHFACRLMEEEGIFYYFKHTEDGHTMVLADSPDSHKDVADPTEISFMELGGGNPMEDYVSVWEKTQEIRSSKVTLRDYCFEMPEKNLEVKQKTLETVSVGDIDHKLKLSVNEGFEIYDYPGFYAPHFDGVPAGGGDQASKLQDIFEDNKRVAKVRMQRESAAGLVVRGESKCRNLASGHKFTLKDHFNGDDSYVLTRVEHTAAMGGPFAGKGISLDYKNTFLCLPYALPYRPSLTTPKPRVYGTQTAVVVGPAGQEVFTDKYGRVKVQFPWDRHGKKDANSSCWVRVATVWAGKQWGAIHIPRIGQEVIIAFIEGDPDQPIIVGSVYNATQMPPYTLPDNLTQSGIKTRSTQQGTAENFSELRFEDKKDSEEVYFHAEKDFNRVVENNDTLKVGSDKADDGSQTIEIYKDRTETVKTGNEKVTIEKGKRDVIVEGDDTHQVKTGNRVVNVDTGNDTHTIKTGNREVKINTGNDTLTIALGNQTTQVQVGKSTTEALQSIELKVGTNSIKIDPSGITIKALMVQITGDTQVAVKGLMTQVNGDAMLQLKGGITMIG